MLEHYSNEIVRLAENFDEKMKKKLSIESLISLSQKLQAYEEYEVEKQMQELKNMLLNMHYEEKTSRREYRKLFSSIKTLVKDEFDIHQKGSIVEKYIGIGLVIGIAVGSGLQSIMPTFIGVGIAVGIAIGSGVGTQKEKELKEAGKLY